MINIWKRLREAWRTDAERNDAQVVEDALRAHEEAERRSRTEQSLSNVQPKTDSTYINPF